MSSLSYRSWDIWANTEYFSESQVFDGYFECTIIGTLMVPQTIEFLTERFEIRQKTFRSISTPPPEIIQKTTVTEEGNICIRLYEPLDTSVNTLDTIKDIQDFIEAISLAVDSPLTCPKIRFVSSAYGKLLVANRRPIGRGVAFEVEERGVAANKIQNDLSFYQDQTDDHHIVGRRHYLTGMQLLSLEDQVSGLVDAAFMQFYQGCEALCRDPKGSIVGSQKHIASTGVSDSRELQIIAHQVWRVRNKYFGHGDVGHNIHANLSKEHAESVAKQALVARYLCRRLIDIGSPSGGHLSREMGFYFGSYSGNFTGSIDQLENDFNVRFDRPLSKVYDSSGKEVEQYSIKQI